MSVKRYKADRYAKFSESKSGIWIDCEDHDKLYKVAEKMAEILSSICSDDYVSLPNGDAGEEALTQWKEVK